jgi:protein TonB
MLELEPVAASPPSETQVEAPPGPLMTESQPEVVEEPEHLVIPDLPPVPKAVAVLKPAPKVKPVKKPKEIPHHHVVTPTHVKPAPRTTAPAHAAASSRAAAAGRKGSAGSSASPSAWISQVHARIQAHHSCPAGARGTAKVAFSIDRGGRILGLGLVSGSGSAALDQAAVSTVRRSNPLPPPPPGIGGTISIPVSCR